VVLIACAVRLSLRRTTAPATAIATSVATNEVSRDDSPGNPGQQLPEPSGSEHHIGPSRSVRPPEHLLRLSCAACAAPQARSASPATIDPVTPRTTVSQSRSEPHPVAAAQSGRPTQAAGRPRHPPAQHRARRRPEARPPFGRSTAERTTARRSPHTTPARNRFSPRARALWLLMEREPDVPDHLGRSVRLTSPTMFSSLRVPRCLPSA
jgi:hypothetical protein